jgi:phosphohistidine phosphatase
LGLKLFFLRHGLAGNSAEWTGPDFERPLTQAGKDKMKREAATIAKLGIRLDVILSSPLVRAFQTAEIVAKRLEIMDRLVAEKRLSPGFGPQALAQLIEERSRASALMLVGHEPDFGATIGQLIGGGRVECKKGSLIAVNLPDPSRLKGDLVWLIPPKVLTL